MVLRATDLKAWKCPECKRVAQVRSDATWVKCCGGYKEDGVTPLHGVTHCYEVSDDEGDPIELARAMGLFRKEVQT